VARPFRPESLVLGLLLVAVGSVWMAANFGRLDLLSTLRTWWPASLVVWGAVELLALALDRVGAGSSGAHRDGEGSPAERGEK
jgi:cell wall-active antibiotic response 4TMS protein YvqF